MRELNIGMMVKILITIKTNKMENIIQTNEKNTCVSVSYYLSSNSISFLGFYSIQRAREFKSIFTIGAWKVKSLKN